MRLKYHWYEIPYGNPPSAGFLFALVKICKYEVMICKYEVMILY